MESVPVGNGCGVGAMVAVCCSFQAMFSCSTIFPINSDVSSSFTAEVCPRPALQSLGESMGHPVSSFNKCPFCLNSLVLVFCLHSAETTSSELASSLP